MTNYEKRGARNLLMSILAPQPIVSYLNMGKDYTKITYDEDTETFNIEQRCLGEVNVVAITEEEIDLINKFIKNGK